MFEVCRSLDEAYTHLLFTREKQRLWTILTFATAAEDVDIKRQGRYYVFTSTASFGGQMFNRARAALTDTGHYGKGVIGGIPLAHAAKEGLGIRALRLGDYDQEGHAEEHMIESIPRILAQEVESRGALPARGIILNSDTPCTTADKNPSSTLPGWPASCTAKLCQLAKSHPQIQWHVFYMRKFGALQGKSVVDVGRTFTAAKRLQGVAVSNIDMYPYTQLMMGQAQQFDLL